jgi:hypothetical protein
MVLKLWSGSAFETAFVLHPSPATSLNVLEKSKVAWKKLRLENFVHTSTISIPKQIKETVTSLVVSNSTVSWAWIQRIVGKFKNANTLSMFQVTRVLEKYEGWLQTVEQVQRFDEFQKRLVSLTLSTPRFDDLDFYLMKLVGKLDINKITKNRTIYDII